MRPLAPAKPFRPRPSRLRPFGLTRGRAITPVDQHLGVERIVATVDFDPQRLFRLMPEAASIYESCQTEHTIAQLAVRLGLPLGVVRVIVADLMAAGRVRVLPEAVPAGARPDAALLERVLHGLNNL